MSTESWTVIADNPPTQADLPCWVAPNNRAEVKAVDILWSLQYLGGYSHWKRGDFPSPPTEPTQSEIDLSACIERFPEAKDDICDSLHLASDRKRIRYIWQTSLAYERHEVFGLLAYLTGCPREELAKKIAIVRERCNPRHP